MTGDAAVEVAVAEGRLRGQRDARGITSFRGVPYAAAPVGPLRFRAPRPHPGWTGVRPADAFGPIAPQRRSMLDQFLGTLDLPTDEDCLTLNLWSPACDDGQRPVLVWIHGGGFTSGAGSSTWYDGSALAAAGDVVVVSLNYRLGVLGFTQLAGLVDGAEAAGNLGLADQVAALRWIRDHAAVFGGDPGNVTAFGESAGGASVVALLAAPSASRLFHRAIVESASFPQLRSVEHATQAAGRLLDRLGIGPADAERLRHLPVDELIEAQQDIAGEPGGWFTAFSPVADGAFLPGTLGAMYDAAAQAPIPVLIGTTQDEMRLFTVLDPSYSVLDEAGLVERFARTLGEAGPAALALYRSIRPGLAPGEVASALATDESFRQPAIRFADARHRAGVAPTWMYRFSWPSPTFGGLLGACHGIELPFVFGTLDAPGVTFLTGEDPARQQLVDDVQDAWLAVARHGAAPWPAYQPDTRATRRLDLPSVVEHDPEGDLRRLWQGAR